MNHIVIKHNPFLVETIFKINGQAPSESSSIAGYSEKRLQLWVEQIFFDLRNFFNGSDNFLFEFTGVESDFFDIQEAAINANNLGMTIELKWNRVEPTESRLSQIKQLMLKMGNSSKFAEYLSNSGSEALRDFDEALNNDFDVYVVATMSSGKSTFINAMLGQDLLPAANEATTATIAHIFDDKSKGSYFSGKRLNCNDEVLDTCESVNLAIMQTWNKDLETKTIELCGDIRAVEQNDNVRLVLTDTPGPNNSQDRDHERTTLSFIQDSRRNPLIVYVLNATQLGTNDDRNLLRLVADIMSKGGKQSKDRFLFVVNKMDMFDPERGENIKEAIGRVKGYLQENGIHDPNIYPVSARMAYLLRKQGELTRTERNDKHNIEELLLEEPSMAFPQYMLLSPKVTKAMEAKSSSNALRNSGLPAVEAVIDEYINKYSFPMRLNRAYLAFTTAIERGMMEAELFSQLETNEQELDQLLVEIENLKQRREVGFNTQAYKEKIKLEGHDLPLAIQNDLNGMEAKILTHINLLGDGFDGETTTSGAEELLAVASKDIEFAFNKTINEYEQAFQNSQEAIKVQLHKEYLNHIASLFPDSRTLELPVFKSLKDSISNISLDIELKDDEVKSKREIVGYRTVSDSSWYNPFTWGNTKNIAEYGDKEFVDLQELWKERVIAIRTSFNETKIGAIKRIVDDKNKLIDNYLAFIEKEFKTKFDALLEDLNIKVTNKDEREQAIAQAKIDLAEIDELKQELAAILQL
ncbi:dynamin family protein [Shewanella frigidimarina]|jgi:predicted GTPase|uniref:dynamin family protein n=1 Tax=Shewanella frigidimarina TaxID=56812 RepID=UPI003D7A7262|tara:strand:+ start:5242 stop:7497 length:2256 start_codon:yes stop_codon:yes gene_type:complete